MRRKKKRLQFNSCKILLISLASHSPTTIFLLCFSMSTAAWTGKKLQLQIYSKIRNWNLIFYSNDGRNFLFFKLLTAMHGSLTWFIRFAFSNFFINSLTLAFWFISQIASDESLYFIIKIVKTLKKALRRRKNILGLMVFWDWMAVKLQKQQFNDIQLNYLSLSLSGSLTFFARPNLITTIYG